LLSKFEHYGIKGHLLVWAENFFTARTQQVIFGGARSWSPRAHGCALRVDPRQRADMCAHSHTTLLLQAREEYRNHQPLKLVAQ
jgi:hypothetical protein